MLTKLNTSKIAVFEYTFINFKRTIYYSSFY